MIKEYFENRKKEKEKINNALLEFTKRTFTDKEIAFIIETMKFLKDKMITSADFEKFSTNFNLDIALARDEALAEIENLKIELSKKNKEIQKLTSSNGGFESKRRKIEADFNAYKTEKEKEIEKLLSENKDLQSEIKTYDSKIKEAEEIKKETSKLIDSLKLDKQSQGEIIQKLADENKEVRHENEKIKKENKPEPPTIEELKKDKMFHGKKNKKRKFQ